MRRVGDSVELVCSFCTKSQREVRKLIAGPSVFICDECVEACRTIIAQEDQQTMGEEGVSETRQSVVRDAAEVATRCALCHMPIVTADGLMVRDRGLVCFGCLGEVEAALAEHRDEGT